MQTIKTAMCIAPTLDWHGRAGVQAVYDTATLAVLGLTAGGIERDADGLLLSFGGVAFRAVRAANGSQWWVLEAIEAAS